MIWCATLDGGGRSSDKVSRPLELSLWDELEHHSFSSILSPFLTTFSEMKPIVSWQRPWSEIKTLPKTQRTRGLSSYHKFKHKSWSNFKFKISIKHYLQNLNQISVFRLNFNFEILTKPCAQSLNKNLALWRNLSFQNCCQHDPHHQSQQQQQLH